MVSPVNCINCTAHCSDRSPAKETIYFRKIIPKANYNFCFFENMNFDCFSTKVNLSGDGDGDGDGVGVVSPGYLVASELPYLVKSLPKPPLLQLLLCWFSVI